MGSEFQISDRVKCISKIALKVTLECIDLVTLTEPEPDVQRRGGGEGVTPTPGRYKFFCSSEQKLEQQFVCVC